MLPMVNSSTKHVSNFDDRFRSYMRILLGMCLTHVHRILTHIEHSWDTMLNTCVSIVLNK